jgi:hypothetical protein
MARFVCVEVKAGIRELIADELSDAGCDVA